MNSVMRECQHCHVAYQWERSQSALRLTFCGVLCEQGELGFTIDGLIRSELTRSPGPGRVSVARHARPIVELVAA